MGSGYGWALVKTDVVGKAAARKRKWHSCGSGERRVPDKHPACTRQGNRGRDWSACGHHRKM